MPQGNVQVVQRLYDALNRRDWDAFGDLCDPEVELRGTIGGLEEARLHHGVDEFRRVTEEEDAEVWDVHLLEPLKFIEAGEQVLVIQREHQRGKSGVELVGQTAVIFDLRDGRISRIQPYMEAAEAVKAAGLPKQDAQV
jgi:ketosteroid isomerase-like protein